MTNEPGGQTMEQETPTKSTPDKPPEREYNYEHFKPGVLMTDVRQYAAQAPDPGEPAPSFELKDTDGRNWKLEELRDRPVVLITGSASCPFTRGSIPGLKGVYDDYGEAAHWFTLYVREAHPGEQLPPHTTYEKKVEQAAFLKKEERLPWPVLIDAIDGRVHHDYGLMPNAVYVIGTDGRIAFRSTVAHGPTLRRALEELHEQDGAGTVLGGVDWGMHMLGPMTYGWDAIRRAGPTAVRNVSRNMPPLAANLWLGEKMAPMTEPVARRSRRLPVAVRAGTAAAVTVAAAAGIWRAVR